MRGVLEESSCLGLQLKAGGKRHLRLNSGRRPIANKYREGKMKSTLKRELKAREIVKRETLGARGADRFSALWWRRRKPRGMHSGLASQGRFAGPDEGPGRWARASACAFIDRLETGLWIVCGGGVRLREMATGAWGQALALGLAATRSAARPLQPDGMASNDPS